MGIQFEKLKKNNILTEQSILVKQGRGRGNKNIFKVGSIESLSPFNTVRY